MKTQYLTQRTLRREALNMGKGGFRQISMNADPPVGYCKVSFPELKCAFLVPSLAHEIENVEYRTIKRKGKSSCC